MGEYILGIDVGTTALKAAVFDCQGVRQAIAVVEYALLTPDITTVEAPCDIYMDSIRKGLAEISAAGRIDTRDIDVVGFSVQGETLCFLDGDYKPLRNAIVWMDNRACRQANRLREKFGDEKCYEVTGQVSFEACWPAAKALWVKENQPDIFARTKHLSLLEDYLIHLLTGRFVSEGSLLSSTEYWDIRTRKYWPEMLDFLGVDEGMLPEIMDPGQFVGLIRPDMADFLGVSPNTKICTGCLDQVAAAIGVGNCSPGVFSENIGAAIGVCMPLRDLTYNADRLMPVYYFTGPDRYMLHSFTMGGMCIRWFRDAFCGLEMEAAQAEGVDPYYLMDKEAVQVEPGCEGLLALPHLQGAMAPDVNLRAKGVFYGVTLKHTKAHFIRSIMEGVGYIISRNIEVVTGMGLEIKQIRSMGGGVKSEVWNQIKADVTGKTLHVTQSSQDASCLGAAILAGCASGIYESIEKACGSMIAIKRSFEPDMENHAIYQRQYAKFKTLYASLGGLFERDN